MDLRPSEEQVLLADMVRRFLADRVPAAEAGKGPSSREDWQAMGELGLLGVALPEAAGGLGGGAQDAAIVAEELGRAFAVTPFAEAILGATGLLASCPDHPALSRRIEAAASGSELVTLALGQVDENVSGLIGSCRFVRWGDDAAAFVIIANDRAWLVDGTADGLTREIIRLADGSRAATLSLEGCAATRLNTGAEAIRHSLAMAQLGYVAEMVGAMSSLLEQTTEYSRQRRQFGVPVGTFQVVQHKLARMFVKLEQSRSILLRAALSDRSPGSFSRNVTAAKAYVADAAQKVAEDAVQIHGGMGVTDELPVGRALRRVLVLTRLFGRADEAREALAA
nr:acyl-CoA dehydrogenase family protein [uncultured Sphingomonas sp.]